VIKLNYLLHSALLYVSDLLVTFMALYPLVMVN